MTNNFNANFLTHKSETKSLNPDHLQGEQLQRLGCTISCIKFEVFEIVSWTSKDNYPFAI